VLSGVMLRLLGGERGLLDAEAVGAAVRPAGLHLARSPAGDAGEHA